MTAWPTGGIAVEKLIADRALQRVPAARRGVDQALARARQLLSSASTLVEADPSTAFVLAYDAARQAGTAVLGQQGLRATASGGHVAVERSLRAQFGSGFIDFHYLRRRRNELEYPQPTVAEAATTGEAREALQSATGIVDRAAELVPRLDLF